MSTTSKQQAQTENTMIAPGKQGLEGWLLILLVFIAGAVSLALEMAASRLLAPYFGTSLFVWSNIIGLILLYLTIGYYLGGRLSDRYPNPRVIYLLSILAALFTGIIPLMGRSVLHWSQQTFGAIIPLGVFYGSLVAMLLLFAWPNILLGCIAPYAIRLRVKQIGHAGRTAGLLYAISTAGSLVGTFVPVLYLMPTFGTERTFYLAATALLLTSLLGLFASSKEDPTV